MKNLKYQVQSRQIQSFLFLTQVQIQYDYAAKQRDLARQRAQLDLDEAQANLDRLTNPLPSDVARARSTLENAKASLFIKSRHTDFVATFWPINKLESIN